MHAMDKPVPIKVELLPSPRLAWLLGAAHAAALLLLVLMPLPVPVIVAASLPLMVSAWLTISGQALRRGRRAIHALECSDRETLRVRTGDGTWRAGELMGSSTVGASLTVLNIRIDRRDTRHVVIAGDGINGDDFRRLRVWLRWGPLPPHSAGESS